MAFFYLLEVKRVIYAKAFNHEFYRISQITRISSYTKIIDIYKCYNLVALDTNALWTF